MGKAITLGLVLGAALAPGFNSVFKTAREQAQGLKTTLANARLGASAAADVSRLGARLERLRAAQSGLGGENAKLAARIAQTERQLKKASDSAARYGVTLENAAGRHRQLAATADQASQALGRLRAAEQRKQVREEAKGQILGTVATAMAVAGPAKEAMEFEHRLRAIGNIADMSAGAVNSLGQSVQQVSKDTNQTTDAMLDAYNVLLGKGMDSSKATAVLGSIGKTATASQASVEDLSTTTFALVDNLHLAESQIPKAMDMLAQSGKEGSFELKDMAKFFPQLTASVATLGMKGPEAVASLGAALQVAMKGAGSTDEAANNFKNFLQKITAPETVKNFEKEFGVNLEASLKRAVARGENPIEYMVGLINKLTKGDKFRVGELFGDMQVGNFLAPMMQHMEEYRQIKEKALGASGVVDRDFANMMGTGTERVKGARIALTQLGVTLGTTLLPAIGAAADVLGSMFSSVAQLAQAYPNLTTVVAFAAVGLVGFKVAVLAARLGGTLLLDGVSLLAGAFNFFRPSVLAANAALVWNKTVTLATAAAQGVWQGVLLVGRAAMLGFSGVLRVVTAAQWLWNAALTANPIGLVITAVAALGFAAYQIYEHWEPIKAWFKSLWDSVVGIFQSALAQVKSLIGAPLDYMEAKLGKVMGLLGVKKSSPEAQAAADAQAGLGQTAASHGKTPAPGAQSLGQTATAHGATPGQPAASQPARAAVPQPALPKPTTANGLAAEKAQALLNDPKWQSPRHQAILRQAIARGGDQAQGVAAPQRQPAPAAVERPAPSPASPAMPQAKGGGQGGVTVNNNVTVTGVGLEHVQQLVKTALDAFSRDLDSKLSAMRAQQMRLSYGG